jgi:hypothetical protein
VNASADALHAGHDDEERTSRRRVREPGAEDVVAVLREREAPSRLRGIPPEIGAVDSPVGRGAAEGQRWICLVRVVDPMVQVKFAARPA